MKLGVSRETERSRAERARGLQRSLSQDGERARVNTGPELEASL